MSLAVSDPHIKVIGFPDDVREAKAKIMSILDTKVSFQRLDSWGDGGWGSSVGDLVGGL